MASTSSSSNELDRLRGLVAKLAKEIDHKNNLLLQKEGLSLEKFASMSHLMEEKDRLLEERSSVIGALMAQKHRLQQAFDEEKQKCEQMKLQLDELINPSGVQQETNEETDLGKYQEDLKTQIASLKRDLAGKGEALLKSERLNEILVLKERSGNEELSAARKEAINFFLTMDLNGNKIGIRRMGEIDPQPFRDACSKKFGSGDWEDKSDQLYSSWQENVSDSSWNPFKKGIKDENLTVDENDKKLTELKRDWGEEVFNAVVDALTDLNEYNSSIRHSVPELWNFDRGRRAYLKEVILYIVELLEMHIKKDTQQSSAITELMADKEKLCQRLTDIGILIGEKDKLLNEKYAIVGGLMAQEAQKDKLLAKMSASVSTLKAEKDILVETCHAEKRKTQCMKQQVDEYKHKLLSHKELGKKSRGFQGRESFNPGGGTTIKLETIDLDPSPTYQLTKKLKASKIWNTELERNSKLDINKEPKPEPDMFGECQAIRPPGFHSSAAFVCKNLNDEVNNV